jgi:predicted dehydrogenase
MMYGTTGSWPGQLRRIEVMGTDGTVIYAEDSFRQWQFRDERDTDKKIREKFAKAGRKAGTADPASIKHVNHTRNFRLFLEALDNNRPFALDGAESRKAVEVILAVYRSAREGRPVRP